MDLGLGPHFLVGAHDIYAWKASSPTNYFLLTSGYFGFVVLGYMALTACCSQTDLSRSDCAYAFLGLSRLSPPRHAEVYKFADVAVKQRSERKLQAHGVPVSSKHFPENNKLQRDPDRTSALPGPDMLAEISRASLLGVALFQTSSPRHGPSEDLAHHG